MGETSIFNINHWDPGRDPVTINWPLTPPVYHTHTYRGLLSSPAAMVPLLSLRAKVWGLRFVNPLTGSLDAGAAPCFPTGPGGGCWVDAPSEVAWGLGLPGKGWEQKRFGWRVKSSLLTWRNHWNRWFCNELWVKAKINKSSQSWEPRSWKFGCAQFSNGTFKDFRDKGKVQYRPVDWMMCCQHWSDYCNLVHQRYKKITWRGTKQLIKDKLPIVRMWGWSLRDMWQSEVC